MASSLTPSLLKLGGGRGLLNSDFERMHQFLYYLDLMLGRIVLWGCLVGLRTGLLLLQKLQLD